MSYRYIKDYRKRFKEKLVHLMGGQCQSCGYNRCVTSFDFHHIHSEEKLFNIGSASIMNWVKIFEEAKKCVLVCSNCHREIHAGIRDCPDVKELKYEKLSPYWIEWDKIELENEIERFTIDEISRKYEIPINTLYRECRKRKIDSSKIRKEDNRKNKLKFTISKDELENLVKEKPFTEIGKMYGVSDNAIRKRCKKLGIDIPKNGRGFWTGHS